jgi:hypothetical protein
MEDLARLAELITAKNAIDTIVATQIGRPAEKGHVGEYIAARIFGITVELSASHKASDGYFAAEPLAGKTVNIKWYAKHEGILDITPAALPDYYLVLAGPKPAPKQKRLRPWVIASVYLFEAQPLVTALAGRKAGIATGVRQELWTQAELYPEQRNTALPLSQEQRAMLALFAPPGP